MNLFANMEMEEGVCFCNTNITTTVVIRILRFKYIYFGGGGEFLHFYSSCLYSKERNKSDMKRINKTN